MKHNKKMRQGIADAKVQALSNAPVKCVACNGSGHYDHNGSPKCGACDGTGFEQKYILWNHSTNKYTVVTKT